MILSTDEEEEVEQKKVQPAKKYKNFLIDEYEEIESVTESQTREESATVIKQVEQPPPQQQQQQEDEEPGKRQLRSCRQQTKDYRCDDFDTKMTEAIIDTGLKTTQDDTDSGK